MSNIKRVPQSHIILGLMTAFGLALSLLIFAPTTANAVPGSAYSQKECYQKGNKGRGSMFDYKVEWSSYQCAKSSTGKWRLNVYNVERVNNYGYFTGATYPSLADCKAAGLRKKGTYQGKAVTWDRYVCNISGNGDGKRVLQIKGLR